MEFTDDQNERNPSLNENSPDARVEHCINECVSAIRGIPMKEPNGARNTNFEYVVKQVLLRYGFTDADKERIGRAFSRRTWRSWGGHIVSQTKLTISNVVPFPDRDEVVHTAFDRQLTYEELMTIESVFRDMALVD